MRIFESVKLVASTILDAAMQVVNSIIQRVQRWKERMYYLDQLQQFGESLDLEAVYSPEQSDIITAQRIANYLKSVFPNGFEEQLKNMTHDELMSFFKVFEKEVEKIMDVDISDVDFYVTNTSPQNGYYGFYSDEDRTLNINAAFIHSNNIELIVEQLFTICHELKHARQFAAIRGEKDYGYSEQQIDSWKVNAAYYIPPALDPEWYRKQPLELDSFGFEQYIRNLL